MRAQNVARCQIAVGLDPRMATRAGFPRNEGIRGVPATSTVDGVTYHRVLPELDPRTVADQLVRANAEAAQALVEALRPAVLHPASNHINAQVALALRDRYGIPVVYEVRGFLEETWRSRAGAEVADSDRYRASREVETACMRDADAVVTLSETMRQDILERGGTDPERVVVVPNAVDVERFVPGPRDPGLAARLGIGDDPVIGYISSFTGYEGIRYLIEAAAELKRRGRRVRCLLVGDGEERPVLEAAARTAGVADGTVIFTGRVPHDQVLDYYRLIDVFVVPRTNDRVSQLVTPLKPYEAMAMERALVVSGVGALLEIVTDGVTGRSFTPRGSDRPGRRPRAAPRRPGRASPAGPGRPNVGDRAPDLASERHSLPVALRESRRRMSADPPASRRRIAFLSYRRPASIRAPNGWPSRPWSTATTRSSMRAGSRACRSWRLAGGTRSCESRPSPNWPFRACAAVDDESWLRCAGKQRLRPVPSLNHPELTRPTRSTWRRRPCPRRHQPQRLRLARSRPDDDWSTGSRRHCGGRSSAGRCAGRGSPRMPWVSGAGGW